MFHHLKDQNLEERNYPLLHVERILLMVDTLEEEEGKVVCRLSSID